MDRKPSNPADEFPLARDHGRACSSCILVLFTLINRRCSAVIDCTVIVCHVPAVRVVVRWWWSAVRLGAEWLAGDPVSVVPVPGQHEIVLAGSVRAAGVRPRLRGTRGGGRRAAVSR